MGKWVKEKQTIIDLLVITSIISVIILMVYYQKSIYPFGNETVAYADMMQQTIPENLYYMWDVLHGKANVFFSWNSGFGINISGATSEQAYLSPLNFFIIFSSRDNLLNFINILLIIKVVCIAIAMYFYLGKYKIDKLHKVGVSILYAFGSSSLIHYNIMFVMDMAFLLPVIMIGYDRIFEKKKCDLFIVICTFCLIENVYMSFMVLLFILINSGVHLIFVTKENKGEYAFLLGISVLISVALSAIITLPALLAISKSSRVQATFFETYLKAIESIWLSKDWNMAKYMLINLSFPSIVCIYNLILRKISKKYVGKNLLMIIIMLIPMIVSGTELLWHGGSRVDWPVRFSFLIAFVIIDCSMQFLQDMGNENIEGRKSWLICIFATILGLLCSRGVYSLLIKLPDIETYKELICLCIICFAIVGYIFVLSSKMRRMGLFSFILLFEMSLMSYLFLAPDMYKTSEYSVSILEDVQGINLKLNEKPVPFERIKNYDGNIPNVNYSLVMGKESLANFIHVIDASFQPVLRKWGYSTHYTRLLDTGGTIFSDTLLGIKYVIGGRELSNLLFENISEYDGARDIHYYLYKNKYDIPLISYIAGNIEQLSNNDLFGNQNNIFRAVTGISEDLIKGYVDIRVDESTIIKIENKKIIYMYSEENQNISIKVDGKDIVVPSKQDVNNRNYPSNFNNNLICLGCFENQTVTIDFANVQNVNGLHLGLLDVEIFEKGIDQINNELRQNTKITRNNTGVKIELNSSREGYIFVPILFDEGWNCKINGNRESIQDAFGFLKVHVQEGENLIHLLMSLFVSILILFYFIPIIKYLEKLLILT
ncbi:MAG: YfhO family protein [Lachnospiraceae bacterium]|nr:YfhO family protein [Lachnospiraceae bacterium]